MSQIRTKKPGETIFGFAMVCLSVFLLWQSYEIAGFSALSSAGAFPMAAAAIMLISSCISLINTAKMPSAESSWSDFVEQILPLTVAVMVGLIFIFAVLLETVGFIISAFVFLVLSIQLLHKQGIARSLLVSVIALIFIYTIFRLVFLVVLPEGIVPEREIMAAIENFFSSEAP